MTTFTQDEIIDMTRKAGGFDATPEFLERFANLVATKVKTQTEQEPVKDWVASHNAICALLRQAHDALALTSYPMMHRWIGLTDVEIDYLLGSTVGENEETHISFARAIESKLKERNT